MPQPLLASKLNIPPLRVSWVSRPRLLGMLDEGLQPDKRLILITAPAGYGKTTLLAEWVHKLQQSEDGQDEIRSLNAAHPAVSWLSIDDYDNATACFFAYLVEAVKRFLNGDQIEALQFDWKDSDLSQPVDWHGCLAGLTNALGRLSHPLILVLEDYQVIQEPAIHQMVHFLIKNMPQNMRVVVLSRIDPPLGLAQLRARGQLCEIRLADLAFTEPEVGKLLNGCLAMDLPAEAVKILEKRTEGWAAGLQLAALAIGPPDQRQPEERSAFIRSFGGSHRYILEYLAEEVINQQPAAVQAFLKCTCMLDRFNAPICDTVLRRVGIQPANPEARIALSIPLELNAAYFLDWLDSHHLFLIPLDPAHEWFRYHPLFADMLKVKLKREHPGFAEMTLAWAAQWREQPAETFRPAPQMPPTDMEAVTNASLPEPLTERELEVLRLLAQGFTNQEIADRLVVTLNTVKKHNYSIFQKLEVPNRGQAILLARKMGLT